MAIYLGSEPVKFTQSSVVEIESPAVKELIEGTISGVYSNSRISAVGDYAFRNCNSLTSIDLPQVTTIETFAFLNCNSLTSINLPLATTIGNYAFSSCYSLTSINLPLATTIENYAFAGCRSLTSVNLPQATTIGDYVFAYCYKLSSIDLPQVTSIGNYAFYSCYNLLSLYLLGSSIPSLISITAFNSTPISNRTTSTSGVYGSIYVPASLYSDYVTALNWSIYSSRIVSI